MKALFVFFLSILTVWNIPTMDTIAKALGAGNVEELAIYFDEQVQVAILDNESLYSKQTAKTALSTFFKNNPPTAFEQLHKGVSEGQESTFFIGNLSTTNASFRVYVYLHNDAGKSVIQELRIDEE